MTSALAQRYEYQGRERHALHPDYHFRNRTVNPNSGRFTQPDPLSYHVNPYGNLYVFADNNPVAYTDPYGLTSCNEMVDMYNRGIHRGITPLGKFWQKLTRDATNPKGAQCFPPLAFCVCCDTPDNKTAVAGGYNFQKHTIMICKEKLDKKHPQVDFDQKMGHELIHVAQYKCNDWEENSCEDLICKEIQAYSHMAEGVVPDREPYSKEFVKDRVANSTGVKTFCSQYEQNNFNEIFERLYNACASAKPGNKPAIIKQQK